MPHSDRLVHNRYKYDATLHPLAVRALILSGKATMEEIAAAFGVTRRQVQTWKSKYPDFAAACDEAGEVIDLQVEQALLKRALGMEYREIGPKGEIIKEALPDPTSCIFWLSNRRPDRWKNMQRQEHSGPGGLPIEIANLSPDERKARIDELISKRDA